MAPEDVYVPLLGTRAYVTLDRRCDQQKDLDYPGLVGWADMSTRSLRVDEEPETQSQNDSM